MPADEEAEVLNALARLMSNMDDPSVLSPDEIVEAIRQARRTRRVAQRLGALELRRRGWSLRDIAAAVGVHYTQPKRWMEDDDPADPAGEDQT